jgi:hypothetical protein
MKTHERIPDKARNFRGDLHRSTPRAGVSAEPFTSPEGEVPARSRGHKKTPRPGVAEGSFPPGRPDGIPPTSG